MDRITVAPFAKPFDAEIAPPGSKSLTNRALVIAALAEGTSTLSNVLFAEDTEVMIEGLRSLGFDVKSDARRATVRVNGRSGAVPAKTADLFCANSGTTIRFLAALCALGDGTYRLDGNERMRARPIGELVGLLSALGVSVTYESQDGYPPIIVTGGGLSGGQALYPAAQSSQYLSALLMTAPYARERDIIVELAPGQTSWPYIEMTARLMALFGVHPWISRDSASGDPRELRVPRGIYQARKYSVEPDASSATYFMAAAAVHPGARARVPGLGHASLQGDVGFAGVLEAMGARVTLDDDAIAVEGPDRLSGIDIDMAGMPDAAMTLAAIAVFASGPTTIRGLHTLRVKETDRLAALQNELQKLGVAVTITGDTLQIEPPAEMQSAEIETYEDHRMAMSFAVVGTRSTGITILGPDCVRKTYPGFFTDLETLRK